MKKIIQASLRIIIYLFIFFLFIVAVRIKQNQVTHQRQKEIISPMNEWKKQGIPVDVMRIKKTDFFGYTKLTIIKKETDIYEGYVSAKDKENFKIGNNVYYEADRNFLCGTVTAISNEINFDKGLYKISIQLDSSVKDFNHREIVFVHTKTIKNIIQVPQEVIDVDDSDKENKYFFVQKLENDIVIKQKVLFENFDREAVVIDEGLNEGDMLIIAGATQIREGYPIFIRKEISQ